MALEVVRERTWEFAKNSSQVNDRRGSRVIERGSLPSQGTAMESSVFVEFNFWLLVFLSVVVPVCIYLLQRRKTDLSPLHVFTFGLILTGIAGLDVYVLQALASASRLTPSLVDNAVFNSAVSLSLYVLPVLFGGVGINLISTVLSGRLLDVGERGERQHLHPGRSLPGRLPDATTLHGFSVQLRKGTATSVTTVLPFTGQDILRRKIQGLLDLLNGDKRSPAIPLHELLSPAFMAASSRFGKFDDMLDASGQIATSQADCNEVVGESWDAFVRSTTQFASWERMLHSACCQWMAKKLFVDQPEQNRQARSFTSASALTALGPAKPQWPDLSSPTPPDQRRMTSRIQFAARASGAGHD